MLELSLPMPPSANRMYRCHRGRAIKSKAYREWIARAELSLLQQLPGPAEPILGPVSLEVVAHFSRKGSDIDNRLKPLGDLCQAAELIENDRRIDYESILRGSPSTEPYVQIRLAGFDP